MESMETVKPVNVGDEWCTPAWLFKVLDEEFQFTLDVACTELNNLIPGNALIDGLVDPWHGVVFVNPPYSDPGTWVSKAIHEIQRGNGPHEIVILLPASTDTQWFAQIVRHAYQIRFLSGRLKFEYQGDPYFPARSGSVLAIFRDDDKDSDKVQVEWVSYNPEGYTFLSRSS